ncbi:histidine phosphatase family protein [candidate division WWE3 bacterium]|nr:histidine phosphatase family protein [candidate division WWE3 bacterium]
MPHLILIRHGETDKNIQKHLHSANDQTHLNTEGQQQIQKTARRLRMFHLSKIYSSTEQRALESAQLISGDLNISVVTLQSLSERNWGVFSDQPWENVKVILDPMSIIERYEYVPPGGESWQAFEHRLTTNILEIVSNANGEDSAIVTHGGVIRALMPVLLHVPREESFKYDPDNASCTIFEYTTIDGPFSPITINDTSHLVS